MEPAPLLLVAGVVLRFRLLDVLLLEFAAELEEEEEGKREC